MSLAQASPSSNQPISCDENNYERFIRDNDLTNRLISKTGKGCHLSRVNLEVAGLHYAGLRSAKLGGVN